MEASIETSTASAPAISFADDVSDLQIQAAQEFGVVTAQNYEHVGEFLTGVKSLRRRIADFFAPLKQAAADSHKKIVAAEKREVEPLDAIEGQIKRAIVTYEEEQARIRREEEARLQAEQRRIEEEVRLQEAATLEAEGKPELAAAVIDAPSIMPPVTLPSAPKPKGISTSEVWDFEVTDLKLVPREFLVLDDKLVRAHVRARKGATAIPGIRAFPKTVVASRGR